MPSTYPPDLEYPGRPGALDHFNVENFSRMQRSFRWQPHLPFFPVDLPREKWAERYNFTFYTLPIVAIGPKSYTLDNNVARRWYSHIDFFTRIVREWRNNLASAPMSVDYLTSINDYDITSTFETDKKARGYFWYYRSLIFSMFAEFSFLCSVRENWRTKLEAFCKERSFTCGKDWLDNLEMALCDFKRTKRAGVIIDVARTQIWRFIPRYHQRGVPVLMEVGWITFHDKDPFPVAPDIRIPPFPPIPIKYPSEWPNPAQIMEKTKKYLYEHFYYRLAIRSDSPPRPLEISRPPVREIGGEIYERPQTSSWVNPVTQRAHPEIQVALPAPPVARGFDDESGWIKFFERRRESNQRREQAETGADRQRRMDRERDARRINDRRLLPSKKSAVFMWTAPETAPAGMQVHVAPELERVRIWGGDIEYHWDRYHPTQRLYDSFRNEWDLNELFNPSVPDEVRRYYDDEDDDDYDEATHIDQANMAASYQVVDNRPSTSSFAVDNRPSTSSIVEEVVDNRPSSSSVVEEVVDNRPSTSSIVVDNRLPTSSFLEELEDTPAGNSYTDLPLLSSQVSFIAPKNLVLWASLALGFKSSGTTRNPLAFKKTPFLIGFVVDEERKKSEEYKHLEEFVLHIVQRQFTNARLSTLSDLAPGHPSLLDLRLADVVIQRVRVSIDPSGTPYRIGYTLRPKREPATSDFAWVLVIFEAISVLQVVRNRWGSSTMESLVTHLVRHGIQFRTLVPSTGALPENILSFNRAPEDFTTLPPLNPDIPCTPEDYSRYVTLRQEIIKSPHGRVAFRMGGILWRLAMESQESLPDVVSEIMAGPSEMGSTRGEYFFVEGVRYYDLVVNQDVGLTICGVWGLKTGTTLSPGRKFYNNFIF